jgi:hypothetical protein
MDKTTNRAFASVVTRTWSAYVSLSRPERGLLGHA